MERNGVCDPQCNTRACGYDAGDCTSAQITTACLEVQDRSGIDYSEPPYPRSGDELVPVRMDVNLAPGRLDVSGDLNEMVLVQALQYSFSWSDARIFDSPCERYLSTILSVSLEAAASDAGRAEHRALRNRFWSPRLTMRNLAPGTSQWDAKGDFVLEREVPSTRQRRRLQQLPAASNVSYWGCTALCASWAAEVEVQITQAQFDYYYYPFDNQSVIVEFGVTGASVTNCEGTSLFTSMGLTESNKNEKLLPGTAAWVVHGNLERAIEAFHPWREDQRSGESFVDFSSCRVVIHIERNPLVFIVKSLLITIIVVFFSLLTVFFMSFDLMGDRFAVLFIAFLIIVTNMQTDLGLGKISYVLWIDLFNLSQLVLTLLVVIETTVVHVLASREMDSLALHADYACRQIMLMITYPGVTLGVLLYGLAAEQKGLEAIGHLLLGLSTLATLVLVPTITKSRMNTTKRQQDASLVALCAVTPTNAHYAEVAATLFDAFDVDGSGTMDQGEFYYLLQRLYPLPGDEAKLWDVRAHMKTVADQDGTIMRPEFVHCLRMAEVTMGKRPSPKGSASLLGAVTSASYEAMVTVSSSVVDKVTHTAASFTPAAASVRAPIAAKLSSVQITSASADKSCASRDALQSYDDGSTESL